MAVSTPIRIDADIHASAKAVAVERSRSTAQQVSHWARIGRELEASRSISHNEIADVLAGNASYDSLNARSQALVRAAWAEQMDERRNSLDLAEEFGAQGRPYAKLDGEGKVMITRNEPASSAGLDGG